MHRPGLSDRSPRRDRWLALLATAAVLAVATAVAARAVDLGAALDALRGADPALLVVAVAVYACSWPLRGRRFDDVLAATVGRVGTGFCTHATFLSQTANLVLPARAGDGVRAYVCNVRRDVPYATGAAALTVERVLDLLALAAVGGAGLLALVAIHGASVGAAVRPTVPSARSASATATVAVGAGLAIALVAVGALALRRRSRSQHRHSVGLGAIADRLPARVVAGARTFARDLATIGRAPRTLALVGAGSLAVWALDALTAVLVLVAVAEPSGPALVAVGAVAVAGGNLAKVLPLTQGGLGLYEGAFAAVVVALSPVAGAVALAAAVLDHAVKNGVTLAGGAVAAVVLGVSPRTSASAARTSTSTARTAGSAARTAASAGRTSASAEPSIERSSEASTGPPSGTSTEATSGTSIDASTGAPAEAPTGTTTDASTAGDRH